MGFHDLLHISWLLKSRAMTQAQAFFLQMIYPNVDSGYGILNSLPFFSPQVWSLISSAPVFSSLIPSQWLVMSASGHNSLWTTRWLHLSSGSSLHFVIQSQTSMKHPLCSGLRLQQEQETIATSLACACHWLGPPSSVPSLPLSPSMP